MQLYMTNTETEQLYPQSLPGHSTRQFPSLWAYPQPPARQREIKAGRNQNSRHARSALI